MRHGRIAFLTLLLLLVVPVASATADHGPGGGGGQQPSALGSAILGTALAVDVTDTRVTLKSRIVPKVRGASATFEYGTTTAYGTTASALPATLPFNGATASVSLEALAPSTTYHFRVVVSLAGIELPGPDALFTTAAAILAPPTVDPPRVDSGGDDHGADNGSDDTAPAPQPVVVPEAPVLGESLAVGPRRGTVRVRGKDGSFEELTAGSTIQSGTVIDATKGTVAVTTALDDKGNVQTGEFSGGRFLIRQAKGGEGTVDIYLRGKIGRCRSAKTAKLAATSRKRKPGRRLWGRDKGGKFRTHGADSVASVRGTRWLTEDTCAGTRTKVTEGAVSVRDLGRKRTVTVRAGQSYLARRSPR
jgi:hypothetical protein